MSRWVTSPARRLLFVATLAAAAVAAPPLVPALAQQVVVVVNGDPITAIDVAQRTKLLALSTHRNPERQEVTDNLIDEKLKLQNAKRYKLEITDSEVDESFKTIASRTNSTPDKFTQNLTTQGLSVEAVKTRIKADMGWSQIIRGKFPEVSQVGERPLIETLRSKRKDGTLAVGYEFQLRPILLIVPRGSGKEVMAARKREADGLRTRFQNCDEGLRVARGLKDVAVREPINPTSGNLSAQLREVLDNTPEGHLTAPETTRQGIELFALCSKREITSELPGKRELREKILQGQFEGQSKRYLKELRASAMIEYK
jgi:peptidyl-prolyl cis-trans isomerase SurA